MNSFDEGRHINSYHACRPTWRLSQHFTPYAPLVCVGKVQGNFHRQFQVWVGILPLPYPCSLPPFPHPSASLSTPPYSSLSLPLPAFLSLLRCRPLNPARRSGVRCKLFPAGMGGVRLPNDIWWILGAVKKLLKMTTNLASLRLKCSVIDMEEGWFNSYEQWHDKEKPQCEGQRLKKDRHKSGLMRLLSVNEF